MNVLSEAETANPRFLRQQEHDPYPTQAGTVHCTAEWPWADFAPSNIASNIASNIVTTVTATTSINSITITMN